MHTCRAMLAALLLAVAAPALERRLPPPDEGDWQLVWQDEFDQAGLPDSTRWDYDLGFERNQEPQLYTRRRENARVEGGLLVLEARRERVPNPAWSAGSADWRKARREAAYTSASLKARDLKAWRYGRFEIRARLPDSAGTWPTFWLLGRHKRWPAGGEVDILEAFGSHPGHNEGTAHFERDGRHATSTRTVAVPGPPGRFHVYAVDWDDRRILFLLDGRVYHTFDLDEAGPGPDNPFRSPFTLLLNLALREDGQGNIPTTTLPARFLVDYVRIWQRR